MENSPDWLTALAYTLIPWMVMVNELPWFGITLQMLAAIPVVLFIHRFGTTLLRRLTATLPFSRNLVEYGHRAGGLVVYLAITQAVLRGAPDALIGIELLRHLNALLLVTAMTWLGIRCIRAVSHTIVELNPADAADNYYARRVQTQTRVLERSATVLLVLLGAGTALMTLPLLKQIGTSLLASAGVAGLIVGFAAKPVLSNLLAGLQIALTQPIRLEDVVIVQNEWGHIEEITGSYVVVRIWDQRRLIVPLQWFIENPFQNWTRRTADILGTVLLWFDYRLPLEPVRREAERICENAGEWDRRLCTVQVVDANERAMQLRVLVSAANASHAWDLRCKMREGLLDFVQRNYPDYLPRLRAEMGAGRTPIGNEQQEQEPS